MNNSNPYIKKQGGFIIPDYDYKGFKEEQHARYPYFVGGMINQGVNMLGSAVGTVGSSFMKDPNKAAKFKEGAEHVGQIVGSTAGIVADAVTGNVPGIVSNSADLVGDVGNTMQQYGNEDVAKAGEVMGQVGSVGSAVSSFIPSNAMSDSMKMTGSMGGPYKKKYATGGPTDPPVKVKITGRGFEKTEENPFIEGQYLTTEDYIDMSPQDFKILQQYKELNDIVRPMLYNDLKYQLRQKGIDVPDTASFDDISRMAVENNVSLKESEGRNYLENIVDASGNPKYPGVYDNWLQLQSQVHQMAGNYGLPLLSTSGKTENAANDAEAGNILTGGRDVSRYFDYELFKEPSEPYQGTGQQATAHGEFNPGIGIVAKNQGRTTPLVSAGQQFGTFTPVDPNQAQDPNAEFEIVDQLQGYSGGKRQSDTQREIYQADQERLQNQPMPGGESDPNNRNAYGGVLKRYGLGGNMPLSEVNAGGTHEENPLGGVPISDEASVEQGETIMNNNFVFSDRIKVPGKKYTFADKSKKIEKKYSARKYDSIDDAQREQELNKLAYEQEMLKEKEAAKAASKLQELGYGNTMAYGGLLKKMGYGGKMKPDGGPVGSHYTFKADEPQQTAWGYANQAFSPIQVTPELNMPDRAVPQEMFHQRGFTGTMNPETGRMEGSSYRNPNPGFHFGYGGRVKPKNDPPDNDPPNNNLSNANNNQAYQDSLYLHNQGIELTEWFKKNIEPKLTGDEDSEFDAAKLWGDKLASDEKWFEAFNRLGGPEYVGQYSPSGREEYAVYHWAKPKGTPAPKSLPTYQEAYKSANKKMFPTYESFVYAAEMWNKEGRNPTKKEIQQFLADQDSANNATTEAAVTPKQSTSASAPAPVVSSNDNINMDYDVTPATPDQRIITGYQNEWIPDSNNPVGGAWQQTPIYSTIKKEVRGIDWNGVNSDSTMRRTIPKESFKKGGKLKSKNNLSNNNLPNDNPPYAEPFGPKGEYGSKERDAYYDNVDNAYISGPWTEDAIATMEGYPPSLEKDFVLPSSPAPAAVKLQGMRLPDGPLSEEEAVRHMVDRRYSNPLQDDDVYDYLSYKLGMTDEDFMQKMYADKNKRYGGYKRLLQKMAAANKERFKNGGKINYFNGGRMNYAPGGPLTQEEIPQRFKDLNDGQRMDLMDYQDSERAAGKRPGSLRKIYNRLKKEGTLGNFIGRYQSYSGVWDQEAIDKFSFSSTTEPNVQRSVVRSATLVDPRTGENVGVSSNSMASGADILKYSTPESREQARQEVREGAARFDERRRAAAAAQARQSSENQQTTKVYTDVDPELSSMFVPKGGNPYPRTFPNYSGVPRLTSSEIDAFSKAGQGTTTSSPNQNTNTSFNYNNAAGTEYTTAESAPEESAYDIHMKMYGETNPYQNFLAGYETPFMDWLEKMGLERGDVFVDKNNVDRVKQITGEQTELSEYEKVLMKMFFDQTIDNNAYGGAIKAYGGRLKMSPGGGIPTDPNELKAFQDWVNAKAGKDITGGYGMGPLTQAAWDTYGDMYMTKDLPTPEKVSPIGAGSLPTNVSPINTEEYTKSGVDRMKNAAVNKIASAGAEDYFITDERSKFGTAMSLAPIGANLMMGMQKPYQFDSERFSLDTPGKLEAPKMNIDPALREISQASNRAADTVRNTGAGAGNIMANMQGLSNREGQNIARTVTAAANQDAMNQMRADQFNIGNEMSVDARNKALALQGEDMTLRSKAARNAFLQQAASQAGQIGQNIQEGEMYIAASNAANPNMQIDPGFANPYKNLFRKRSQDGKAYGGCLKRKK